MTKASSVLGERLECVDAGDVAICLVCICVESEQLLRLAPKAFVTLGQKP